MYEEILGYIISEARSKKGLLRVWTHKTRPDICILFQDKKFIAKGSREEIMKKYERMI